MGGLNNLSKRLDYRGGRSQEKRMEIDKLNSLKKALLYSYQAETIALQDEKGEYNREFRCLINPDKDKPDYDNKLISIPYEDIQLNAEKVGKTLEGIVPTNITVGQTFYWKEDNTYWIVYLWHDEERAYFNAEIRRCEEKVTINEKEYWVYFRGPVETTVPWNYKTGVSWNDMNYTAILYITKNEDTLDFFHRFTKVKVKGKPWYVAAVDSNSGDGIIEVQLKEWYTNDIDEEAQKRREEEEQQIIEQDKVCEIVGKAIVYPFDIVTYTIEGQEGGKWKFTSSKIIPLSYDQNTLKIEIISPRSGSFVLEYEFPDGTVYKKEVIIKSM